MIIRSTRSAKNAKNARSMQNIRTFGPIIWEFDVITGLKFMDFNSIQLSKSKKKKRQING